MVVYSHLGYLIHKLLHLALSDAVSKHKLSIEYKAADRTAPEKTKRCVHRARCPFTCPNPKVGTLKNGVITLVFSEYQGTDSQATRARVNSFISYQWLRESRCEGVSRLICEEGKT